jgi:predicted aminopeptidase
MEEQGYDTYVRPAVAFSTLGWFDDPVLSNLLALDRIVLAGVIIHELFHRTFFLPGDIAFDESSATWVGNRGAVDFFTAQEDPGAAAEARAILSSDLKFAAFLSVAESKLIRLYTSGLPHEEILRKRKEVFAEIQSDYAWLKPQLSGLERFDLDREPLNNAVFLNYAIYFRHLNDFAALERLNGGHVRPTIEQIISLAESDTSDPFYAIWTQAQKAPPAEPMIILPIPPLHPDKPGGSPSPEAPPK